jgi:superoxide dismutase
MNTNKHSKHPIILDVRKFPNLTTIKGIPGSSLDAMQSRYVTAVEKTNEILFRMRGVDRHTAHPVFSEMRSLLTALPPALATVRTYEIFFSQFSGKSRSPEGLLPSQIARDFGSQEEFLEELTRTALCSRGWAAVVYDRDLQRLMCVIGDSPEQLMVWNTVPVLVLEVTERGSAPESSAGRPAYLTALLDHLDWRVIERNLEDALGMQPAGRAD